MCSEALSVAHRVTVLSELKVFDKEWDVTQYTLPAASTLYSAQRILDFPEALGIRPLLGKQAAAI